MNVSGNLNLRGISQFATTLGGLFSQASSFLAPTKIPFEYPTLGCAFGYQVIEIAMRSYSLKLLAIAHPHSSPKPRILISRQFDGRDVYANWPSYDKLPLDPSYPTKAAWGVWVSNQA